MKGALTRAFVVIVIIGLLISGVLSAVMFDRRITTEKEQALTGLARTTAALYIPAEDADEQAHTFAEYTSTRVTILDADGNVIGDSEADYTTMENHSDREEIRAASQGRLTVAIRTSTTLGTKMMYAAIQTESGNYIRLSQEYNAISADFLSLVPGIVIAMLLALVISVLIARKIVSGITGPLAAMDESLTGVKDGTTMLDADSYPYEELQCMAAKINVIAMDVSTYIQSLQAERDRTEVLLDNVREGFLFLNEARQVMIINKSACDIFGCTKETQGGHLLTIVRDPVVTEGAEEAFRTGQNGSGELERQGRLFGVRFTPVSQDGQEGPGLIITLADVTEARRAAQMREEFFSNASHELKTPITAIKGNAELLCSELPLDEDSRQELLRRIGSETDRMNTLIGDIIMISRIENSDLDEKETELVQVEDVIHTCVDETASLAWENQVTVHTDLSPVTVVASQKYIYQLVNNLLVNAEKYNRPGGRVDIKLRQDGDRAIFSIRNDGEPIPPESLSRVFERFYRVDKGRSRAVGGTGLGLSIVKHVVDRLQGDVSLTSSAQNGTLVVVHLPAYTKEGTEEEKEP